jgi:class 3 adenylate cyclase
VESFPLPDDPALSAWASALNEAGHWAIVLDANWRYVFRTEELQRTFSDMVGDSPVRFPLGSHLFSKEVNQHLAATLGGTWRDGEFRRAYFRDELGPYVLASTPGGRDALRRVVDPELADLIEDLHPQEVPHTWIVRPVWTTAGADATGCDVWFRVEDGHGRVAGFCLLSKPAAGMSHLGALSTIADLAHLERMRVVERPDRRPAAILMADLEASSPLARRLSTAQYFAFGRRLLRTADRCIIDAGGIVGRHAGDGVVAFFLADTTGSESAAARGCINAARNLRDLLPDIAARSELSDAEISLRFGLHWGATLYMGRILTAGRSEVTALGDEANEAARIEACASGGKTLASKSLIERLDRADADALGLDTGHTKYTPLADLSTATDKARRDAPSIAVCEV